MFTGWLCSSETEDPRIRICCHLSPTPFTNQPHAKSESTGASTPKEALTFFTRLSITTSLSWPKKEIVRDFWKSTTVILSSPKWSTALNLRVAFHHKASHHMQCFLHLKETLAAVTEDPGSINSKLNCRTFFLSVQTNHSCLKERPRITKSMTPLSCCFLVCAHRNKIWVAVTLPHI